MYESGETAAGGACEKESAVRKGRKGGISGCLGVGT